MMAIIALPRLWTTVALGDICEIERGVTFPSDAQTSLPIEGNIACLRTSNVQEQVDWENLIYIPRSYVQNEKKLVRYNDILISIANSKELVGKVSFVDEVKEEAAFGGFISVIRATDLIDPYYLYSFLRAKNTQEKLRSVSNQTTNIANLTTKAIDQLPIPLPPLPEQRRIAAILRQADMLRQWRLDANEKTDVLLVSLFNYLFGDFSRQIKFPARSLESIAEVVSGVAKGRRLSNPITVPYLRVANVQAGHLDLREIKTIQALPEEVKQLALKKGDVLLTEGGDYDKLGRGALLDADLPPNCIHQNHVFRVRVDKNLLLPVYFATYLLTSHARTYFLQASKRTTNLASINLSQLKALSVPIPPLELQEEFAEMVTVFRTVEQTQSTSSNKLDDLFVSLLFLAFSGDLTSIWREKRKDELKRAAVERDQKLGVRGQVATLIDAVESRLTPEEEELFRKTTARIAEKIATFQPDMPNIKEKLVAISDFSALEILASRMADQTTVVQNMQQALSVFALSVQTSLAQMSSIFNASGSLPQALVRSGETFREAFAGSLAKIAAENVERAKREQELSEVELSEEQKGIFTLLQNKTGYFSARSISQEYSLQQQEVIDILALFESIGMVVKVDIPDETNSTPTFTVFRTIYRNSRSNDDNRVADLDVLEANTNETGA